MPVSLLLVFMFDLKFVCRVGHFDVGLMERGLNGRVDLVQHVIAVMDAVNPPTHIDLAGGFAKLDEEHIDGPIRQHAVDLTHGVSDDRTQGLHVRAIGEPDLGFGAIEGFRGGIVDHLAMDDTRVGTVTKR